MKYSVSEMEQSPEGRKKLAKEREKYWKESLQPSDPRFFKVYGNQIKKENELQDKKKRESQDYILEREERKRYNKR